MIHFIGIKGSGMSSLAQIMHTLGYEVQGSDVAKEFFTEIGLRDKNIPVFVYDKKNIKEGMDIVRGNSIKDDNEEIIEANKLGLKIYSYQEMVGELVKKYNTIAISGCHGKTTTTAMLSHVLDNIAGCNYLIGDGTGSAAKENEYFALEACEYQRHFLSYYPKYIIITNIELDHVDYYKNINDLMDAYSEFAKKAEKRVIAWGDDANIRALNLNSVIYYGLSDDNNVVAKNIIYSKHGTEFDVYIENEFKCHFNLPFFGEHFILNSLAVVTLCYLENIAIAEVGRYLATFAGAKRRFSEKIVDDTVIIDDYAHHPTEIKATISAAKQKYPDKELVAIFQPHTFSRTEKFVNEYIDVLNLADKSYVIDLHPARENQIDYPDVSSHMIIDNLRNGEHLNMTEAIKLSPHKNGVLLFMGANDLANLENDFEKLITNEKTE